MTTMRPLIATIDSRTRYKKQKSLSIGEVQIRMEPLRNTRKARKTQLPL